ncbi:hypothetical protein QVD17_39136 [Tagetes erecta]|uniref:Serpin domain-containing protein n=1 Tax=Tagetes erecta TaxID=13708 RepID=A0AAD8N9Y6_TARER|nr:hypothetical protein QVD17_39136 [Tagetes erecta]
MFASSLRGYMLQAPTSFVNILLSNLRSPHRLLSRSSFVSKSKKPINLPHLIRKQTNVSTTLTTHLLSIKYPDSNVVFSPLSIHVVLSMLAAGSKGPTHDQLLKFLKTKSADDLNELSLHLVTWVLADGSPRGGPRLVFANGLWVEKTLSLKPSFTQVVDTFYKAACKQVDFRKKVSSSLCLLFLYRSCRWE